MHSIFFYFLIVLGGAETACWILALHEVQGEEEKSYLFPGVELPALYLVSENTHVFCLFFLPPNSTEVMHRIYSRNRAGSSLHNTASLRLHRRRAAGAQGPEGILLPLYSSISAGQGRFCPVASLPCGFHFKLQKERDHMPRSLPPKIKQLSSWVQQRQNTKQLSLPRFCPPSLHRTRDTPTRRFPTVREEAQAEVSKGTRGRFSGARAGFYYSVKNKNKFHLLSTSSASHDTSFFTYI